MINNYEAQAWRDMLAHSSDSQKAVDAAFVRGADLAVIVRTGALGHDDMGQKEGSEPEKQRIAQAPARRVVRNRCASCTVAQRD